MSYSIRCENCTRIIGPRGVPPPRYCAVCGADLPDREFDGSFAESGEHAGAGHVYEGPSTSGLAMASVVAGNLGFCTFGVSGLLGIVLGVAAHHAIERSNGRLQGRGIATIGIVLGCGSVALGIAFCYGVAH